MGLNHSPRIVSDGLAIYLDAANQKSYPGSGTTWTDLSGNGRNFTWNAEPTYVANGSNSHFTTLGKSASGPNADSLGYSASTGYTVVIISQNISAVDSTAFYFPKAGDAGSGADRSISLHLPYSDNSVYFDQGGCCSSDTRTSINQSGIMTNWNMWCFRRVTGSSTRHIIRNGSIIATNTNAAADPAPISSPVLINNGTAVPARAWNARLSSFMFYNRGLSAAEIQQNFNALRGRFGI
jgi:hypothetical protein